MGSFPHPHFDLYCREHDVRIGGCRCASKDKLKQYTDCPGTCEPQPEAPSEREPIKVPPHTPGMGTPSIPMKGYVGPLTMPLVPDEPVTTIAKDAAAPREEELVVFGLELVETEPGKYDWLDDNDPPAAPREDEPRYTLNEIYQAIYEAERKWKPISIKPFSDYIREALAPPTPSAHYLDARTDEEREADRKMEVVTTYAGTDDPGGLTWVNGDSSSAKVGSFADSKSGDSQGVERAPSDSISQHLLAPVRDGDDALADRLEEMAEDLADQFLCPECGGSYFGSTLDPKTKQVVTRHCHDQTEVGCRWSGKPEDASPDPEGVANLRQAAARLRGGTDG